MLEPSERTSFLDALRPPAGYRLDAGIGTAFSLEFDVLTAVLQAFVDAEVDEEAGRQNPAVVVQAITRLSGRLRIFVNRGSILFDVGRRPSRLFALFDRIVRDITLADASFHPKVWVLKYAPRQSPELADAHPVYRLVCSSRNLSASTSWELGMRLDGARKRRPGEMGRALAGFCRAVLARDERVARVLADLAAEVEAVHFVTSREMEESLEFLWQWPGRPGLSRHLPGRGHRALLMAPFVRASFLDRLFGRFDKLTIISRQEELDALGETIHSQLAGAEVYVVCPRETVTGEPALDLHGKLLMTDGPEGSRTYLGSANASSRAWGLSESRNCEAMVAMSPGVGIDRFVKAFVRGPDGIHPWIEAYRRSVEPPDEIETARRALDEAVAKVGQIEVSVRYQREARVLGLAAQPPQPPALAELSTRYAIEVAPLLLLASREAFRPLVELYADEIRYPEVELADVSEFVVVRIVDRDHQLERSCVIRAQSDFDNELRDWRDDAVRADLLARSDVRALLWNILWGVGGHPAGLRDDRVTRDGDGGHRQPLLSEVTIEGLLEACTEDPSRIEEIDALLRAFKDNPAVDSAFVEFWERFKQAHATVEREAARG